MTGIASDIFGYFLSLIAGGAGVKAHYPTTGTNLPVKVLPDTNYILPSFTVLNSGSNTIYLGYGGNADTNGFPLVAGASYTWRWKNPVKLGLCFIDNSSAATVDVIS